MNPSVAKGSEALVGAVKSPLQSIRPLHDNVLLEVLGRSGQEEQIEGSVLIKPAMAMDTTRTRGRVVAVGPGKLMGAVSARKPMSVKPGDEVTFELGAGTLLRVGGREYLMVTDEQITGVVDSAPPPPKRAADQCPACGERGLAIDKLNGACSALDCPDPTAWFQDLSQAVKDFLG